jgi:alkaline phosphatase D
MDAWDGYRASRQRITQGWVDAEVRNPVVLTGDVHAHWASDLYLDYDEAASTEPVGSELITSSITSGGDGYDEPDGTHPWAEWNPNLRFWTNLRGYVSTTITPTEMTARFRCVDRVTTPGAEAFTRATFVLEDGVRGLQEVQAAPVPQLRSTRTARTDEQKISDTTASETHSG